MMKNEYKLTDQDEAEIIDSLDDTGGYLVKGSELRYWIAEHVRRDRAKRSEPEPILPPHKTFRFRDYPFRWLVVWLLWKLGRGLECPARMSWPLARTLHTAYWTCIYLHCPTFARFFNVRLGKIEMRIYNAEKELLNRSVCHV